ncbi:MAG TPA: hypothetical protein VMU08_05070 [Rhizomicrobium sp.]|nr:hypothetical protein [Rhizomicrobium sp.]
MGIRIAFGAALALFLTAAPAAAMHWSIYAPDEAGSRYWIDRDSIEKRGDYTYFTWLALDEDSTAPTTPDGNQWAINCANGKSLKLANGDWVAGPPFTDEAYLFKFVCQRR